MMRLLYLAAVIFAVAGCVVPVGINKNDAGVLSSEDSGVLPPVDAGWVLPCDQNVDTSVDVSFTVPSDCSNGPLKLLGPDGGVVAESGQLVTPSEPGVYLLEDELGAQTFVHVDGPLTGGFTRTYGDRMDRFQDMLVTDSQRLIGSDLNAMSTVYEADGGRIAEFLTYPYRFSGNVMWALIGGRVERCVETANGVELVASLEHSIASDQGAHFADATNDRAIVAGWGGLYEFIWNGTTLELASSFPLIPYSTGACYIEDGGVTNAQFCSVRAGCASEVCDPVVMCGTQNERIVSRWGPDAFWVAGIPAEYPWFYDVPGESLTSLRLVGRPVSAAQPLTPKRSLYNVGYPSSTATGFSVSAIPMPQNGSFYFGYARRVLAVGQHVVVVMDDPFTLRFIPR